MSSNNIWGADAPYEADRIILEVLTTWCKDQDAGRLDEHLPSPLYTWKGAKEPSDEEIETLFAEIDLYIEKEWRNWGKARGFDGPAAFGALTLEQKRTLLQEIDAALPEELPAQV